MLFENWTFFTCHFIQISLLLCKKYCFLYVFLLADFFLVISEPWRNACDQFKEGLFKLFSYAIEITVCRIIALTLHVWVIWALDYLVKADINHLEDISLIVLYFYREVEVAIVEVRIQKIYGDACACSQSKSHYEPIRGE